ncbi:MAG TPA: biotin/lipoyl-binding protein [Gemmatimonadales bacterium]|nr:biotin/lipoyl-binding protein [Gemmatimonadales bacterium]
MLWARSRSAVTVETIIAAPMASGGGGTGGGGTTSVTANGYVVARTRAAVSAKIPGRIASLTVDGGSNVRRGEVIARLENDDYAAAAAEARANVTSARAQLSEAATERDQSAREAHRLARIHGEHPELISAQDVEAAEAALRYAQATLENTYIRAPFTGTVLRKEAEVGEVVAPSVGGGLTRGAVQAIR